MQSWGGKINKKNLNVKWRFLTFYQMLMEPENYLFGCSVFTFFSPLCDQKEQFLQNIIYYYRKKEAVYISYRELNLYLTHNMIILQPNPIHISISCNLKKNLKRCWQQAENTIISGRVLYLYRHCSFQNYMGECKIAQKKCGFQYIEYLCSMQVLQTLCPQEQ